MSNKASEEEYARLVREGEKKMEEEYARLMLECDKKAAEYEFVIASANYKVHQAQTDRSSFLAEKEELVCVNSQLHVSFNTVKMSTSPDLSGLEPLKITPRQLLADWAAFHCIRPEAMNELLQILKEEVSNNWYEYNF